MTFGPVEIRGFGTAAETVITYPHPSFRLVNGVPSYLHRDHLGSIRSITSESGAEVESRHYRPYGEMEADASPVMTTETKGWIGERYDAGAGLQYLNARYYDPAIGLFLQPDWWEVTWAGVGTNRYAYSAGDPINRTDPGGNSSTSSGDDDEGVVRTARQQASLDAYLDNNEDFGHAKAQFGHSGNTRMSQGLAAMNRETGLVSYYHKGGYVGTFDPSGGVTKSSRGLGGGGGGIGTVGGALIDLALIDPDYLASLPLGHPLGAPIHTASPLDFFNATRPGRLTRRLCSFHGDTLVLTEDGMVAIRDIEVGTNVWSRNPATGEMGWQEVLAQYSNQYDETVRVRIRDVESGDEQEIVSNRIHPFFVQTMRAVSDSSEGHVYEGPIEGGIWVDAADLVEGDRLLNEDASWVEVMSVQASPIALEAFNLTVADYHTYFVSQREGAKAVWVHNSCYDTDVILSTLGVERGQFHKRIKREILTDFREELQRTGVRNPDIGVNASGNIVFRDPRNKREILSTNTQLSLYGN